MFVHDGRVAADIPCTQCDYCLRTLPVASRCPECGLEVWASLSPYWLHLRPPGELRRLNLLVWLFAAVWLLYPLLRAFVSFGPLGNLMVGSTVNMADWATVMVKRAVLNAAALLVLGPLVWLILRLPRDWPDVRGRRIAANVLAVVALAATATQVVLAVWWRSAPQAAEAGLVVGTVAAGTLAVLVTMVLWPALVFRHWCTLAGYARSERLVSWTYRTSQALFVAAGSLMLEGAAFLASEIHESARLSSQDLAKDVVLYVFPLTLCVGLPLYGLVAATSIGLTVVLRRILRQAEGLSESTTSTPHDDDHGPRNSGSVPASGSLADMGEARQ